jgi:hypothetical protein
MANCAGKLKVFRFNADPDPTFYLCVGPGRGFAITQSHLFHF